MSVYPSVRISALTLAALSLAAEPGPSVKRGDLLELGPLEQTAFSSFLLDFTGHLDRDLAKRKADWSTFGPMVVFQRMFQENAASTVPSRRFTYASEDSHGKGAEAHERTYSGRIFLPPLKAGAPRPMPVPLVVYQHATETNRGFTPYYGRGDETLLGAMAASLGGFAVAMPDGDGMGADPRQQEMHHYCYGETAAKCVIDCIRAVLGETEKTDAEGEGALGIFDNKDYVWNGQTFIVGYSEGGYIAMAAVKELSTNPEYRSIELTGAACMAGPFQFAKATGDLLDKGNVAPYDRPYIPAYFLKAWDSVFPNVVRFGDAVNQELLKDGKDGSISTWLNGKLGGDQISPLIQKRLTGNENKAVSARTVLDAKWLGRNVDSPGSELNALIKDNDLLQAPWTPRAPVLLVQDPNDRTVGYANSAAAYDLWVKAGAKPLGIVKLGVAGVGGAGHVGGAILAIPTAFTWIGAGMPDSIGDMAASKIQEAIRSTSSPVLGKDGADALARMVDTGRDENVPVLPLSRIGIRDSKSAYTVTFDDFWSVIGKVKFYTLVKDPIDKGQPKVTLGGITGYTKLLKEMKKKGDRFTTADSLPANCVDPGALFMAVYPQNGFVALTLKFTGGPVNKVDNYIINIKQALKSKVVGRQATPFFSLSDNVKERTAAFAFENVGTVQPFLNLP